MKFNESISCAIGLASNSCNWYIIEPVKLDIFQSQTPYPEYNNITTPQDYRPKKIGTFNIPNK